MQERDAGKRFSGWVHLAIPGVLKLREVPSAVTPETIPQAGVICLKNNGDMRVSAPEKLFFALFFPPTPKMGTFYDYLN